MLNATPEDIKATLGKDLPFRMEVDLQSNGARNQSLKAQWFDTDGSLVATYKAESRPVKLYDGWQYKGESDKDEYYLDRTHVEATYRGCHICKIMHRNTIDLVREHFENGEKAIAVHAGGTIGSFTWATLGFEPHQDVWNQMRESDESIVRNRVYRLTVMPGVDPEKRAVAQELWENGVFENPDPKALWIIANSKIGAEVMTNDPKMDEYGSEYNLRWQGKISLNDPVAMRVAEERTANARVDLVKAASQKGMAL